MDIDYPAFDIDNHYYEALDAFTRHLDPKLGPRCVQWATIDGRQYHVVGGKVSRAVVNATFDPVVKAGAMHDFFRGNAGGKSAMEFMKDREPIPAHYREPGARVKIMDQQGLEKIWLFPTLGMLYEEALKADPKGVTLTFTAFNRWLEEDWGFNHDNRIMAAPYISLCDVDWAVSELEWALDRGAHVLVMRPAAPTTDTGQRSPFHQSFDPFWNRVNEAGIPVVIHAGDSGYHSQGYADDKFAASFGGTWKPSIRSFAIERAAFDFLITAAFESAFTRFPNLRLASIENGSTFLPDLFSKLASTAKKMPAWAKEDPCELFREHVWMNPFWEDDPYQVIDCMGPERVIFGSDWPHIEGMPQPLDYLNELKELDSAIVQRVVRDNARELNTLRPLGT
ncbi:MAG TPA: amidohydrolase family protein [Ilumatobacter sp.]|nr:amidohydrolase family protein [Ilumatobacter sp.]